MPSLLDIDTGSVLPAQGSLARATARQLSCQQTVLTVQAKVLEACMFVRHQALLESYIRQCESNCTGLC